MNQPESTAGHILAIATAMDLEAQPFLARLQNPTVYKLANQTWTSGTIDDVPVVVVVTGIGLANAAAAAARTLMLFDNALAGYICAGTCGGLGADVEVGQVVVGREFLYSLADATAFGYAPGQVPGLPATFPASPAFLQAFNTLEDARFTPGGTSGVPSTSLPVTLDGGGSLPAVRIGQVVSSDAFVTAANVESTRELFPLALGTDMESAAAAQACSLSGVSFLSVRGVSDLCGPRAGQDFHIDARDAALASARVLGAVLPYLSVADRPATATQ